MRKVIAAALFLVALPLWSTATAQDAVLSQVPFGERIEGQLTDPLGIWSDDELAESQVYTRQWILNGEVQAQGRTLIVSMLFGDLCSIKECPLRVVLKDGEQLLPVLPAAQGPFEFEMVCQSPEQVLITGDGALLQACGADYPLSFPS